MPAMMRAFAKATDFAAARASKGKPVVLAEDFLLALAMEPSAALGAATAESGIDLRKLEQAVRE